uniref:ATP synthase B chain precursor n=1 Tax=Grateloupia cornea TaxID=176235 RepID=UPI00257C92DF|nr:ATP synthase B chain precursor [Grateloupia cornea]WIA66127.1 ATP synthase B chain precursor [Grateloupia cornea]
MINFSLLCLTFLFLVSQSILLLNEEILILFCFIIFCWLSFNRLNESVSLDFSNRSTKIEQTFTESLTQVEEELIVNSKIQKKFKNLALDFKTLKNHFIALNKLVYSKLSVFLIKNSHATYLSKLVFAQRLEQQTAKLLALLLSKKLHRIVLLRQFYTQKLKFSNFLCFYKICLREYFEII